MSEEIKSGDCISLCVDNGKTLRGVFVELEEYERLKRLEENLNKNIDELKSLPILTNPEERILQALESLLG
jgi:hypothetical protein